MDSDSWLGIVFSVLLFLILALASLAERVFLRLQQAETIEELDETSLHLLDNQTPLFYALAGLRTLALVGLTATLLYLLVRLLGNPWTGAATTLVAVLLLALMLQAIASLLARRNARAIALRLAPPTLYLAKALWPVPRRWNGKELAPRGSRAAENGGAPLPVDTEERVGGKEEMIRSILRLDQTTAREIMTHRLDIAAAEVNTHIREAADLMLQEGHSRLPVYRDSIDTIVGVVYARDLLRLLGNEAGDVSLEDLCRPVHFVPETKRVDDLLWEFQKGRVHVAIVVDEYGGTAGLVTIEDLLEEIVGEIEDEFYTGEPLVQKVSEREAVLDGRASVEELHRLFSLDVAGQGFDTVGGLVYHHLGRVPLPGDTLQVESLRIEVLSTLGRRIQKVRVTLAEGQEPG